MIMTLPAFPFELSLTLDVALIAICGLSCLYCVRLSRRLSKLNNLKSGVGASIISLTEAIEQTHAATKESQSTTVQTIETLRHLISSAHNTISRMEAKQIDLDRNVATTRALKKHLSQIVDSKLSPSIKKAMETASSMENMLKELENYKTKSQTALRTETPITEENENNLAYFYTNTEPPTDVHVDENDLQEESSSNLKLIASQ
jgi:vacuolar-type H+-ATPase subunit I/STV1